MRKSIFLASNVNLIVANLPLCFVFTEFVPNLIERKNPIFLFYAPALLTHKLHYDIKVE